VRDVRVIAGTHGGRRLRAPGGDRVRPTSDRVREALFSSLAPLLPGARVLDLYAGSGALGIEALSRGAASAVFVESRPAVARVVRGNLAALGLEPRARVVTAEVGAVGAYTGQGAGFDLVLADPPYRHGVDELVGALAALRSSGTLASGATVVVERDRRAEDAFPGWLDPQRRRTYGDTVLHVLKIQKENARP
jgi:16S rRNA (guanine966-N2)-methyltransferase